MRGRADWYKVFRPEQAVAPLDNRHFEAVDIALADLLDVARAETDQLVDAGLNALLKNCVHDGVDLRLVRIAYPCECIDTAPGGADHAAPRLGSNVDWMLKRWDGGTLRVFPRYFNVCSPALATWAS